MKNIVTEITYSMNGLKRLDRFEDRTSELEEKSKKRFTEFSIQKHRDRRCERTRDVEDIMR